jgi:hypothetical protein
MATRQDGIWGERPWESAAPSGSQPTCRGAAAPVRARSPISPDDPEEAMRIGTILLVIWLVIGAVAAGHLT